jgi:hypothetical protein
MSSMNVVDINSLHNNAEIKDKLREYFNQISIIKTKLGNKNIIIGYFTQLFIIQQTKKKQGFGTKIVHAILKKVDYLIIQNGVDWWDRFSQIQIPCDDGMGKQIIDLASEYNTFFGDCTILIGNRNNNNSRGILHNEYKENERVKKNTSGFAVEYGGYMTKKKKSKKKKSIKKKSKKKKNK